MPTYAFRCPNGHEFDKFYRMMSASQAELPCRECGAIAVRQISGGAGLVFKGSGFYLTDYGKNAHTRRGNEPPPKSSEGGSASEKPASADGAKSGESKSSESKGGESKSGEPKSSESKTGESRGKPSPPPAPATPSSGSSSGAKGDAKSGS
ncbi:MAG: FmdB family zinc ribbon protein [Gemmatimonadaceae bacterium]